MKIDEFSAEQIAAHQLFAAIKLWCEDDFLSALTLAGAAEEILGRRLRKLGREPSFDQLKDLIIAVAKQHGDSDPASGRLIGDLLNQTRNDLKHYAGDELLSFDLRADSSEMLDRAIANYHLLTGHMPDEVMRYWSHADGE